MNQLQSNIAHYKAFVDTPLAADPAVQTAVNRIITLLECHAPVSDSAIKERNAEFGRLVVEAIEAATAYSDAATTFYDELNEGDNEEDYRVQAILEREQPLTNHPRDKCRD